MYKRLGKITLGILLGLCTVRTLPVHAEDVYMGFDEVGRTYSLRRAVPVAINVYAKDSTVPQVVHEQGEFNNCQYDILRVDPSEDTFVQVDYNPAPIMLSDLYDYDLVQQGYHRIGGINGGYFSNTDYEYGKPAGAVRRYNQWCYWNGEELAPSYGNGYVTAYWNNTDMTLKYHGWINNGWYPYDDGIWIAETNGIHAYGISSKFALSGSYTYMVDGQELDLTYGGSGMMNYRQSTRACSVFAQREDKQYLLISFFGYINDASIMEFLRKENVTDAIRLDGGGSTQMVYDDELVNMPYVRSDYPDIVQDAPLFGWGNVAAGYPAIPAPVGYNVTVSVTDGENTLYDGVLPQGGTFEIRDRKGNTVYLLEDVQKPVVLQAEATSSQNLIATNDEDTFYYDSQEYGHLESFLTSGSSTHTMLLMQSDGEIPPRDEFTLTVYDGDTIVKEFRETRPVTIAIRDTNGDILNTYSADTDGEYRLEYEAPAGYRLASWEIYGSDLSPVFVPVLEEKNILEKFTDIVSALF